MLPKVKAYPNFAEVRLDIMKINDELCTETFLGNLIAYVPSKDDNLKVMEKYQKETPEVCEEELDIPEQFTIEVSLAHVCVYTCLYSLAVCVDVSHVSLRSTYSIHAVPRAVLGKV